MGKLQKTHTYVTKKGQTDLDDGTSVIVRSPHQPGGSIKDYWQPTDLLDRNNNAITKIQPKTMVSLSLALSLFLATGTQAFVPATNKQSTSALNAVSKKDTYSVTLLPGDGIGPEITAATKVALEALTQKCGFKIELKEALIGGAAIDAKNDPFPQESLDQCLASDSVLLACIGGYKWDNNPRNLRPETGLLKMRKEMGLFANLRPAKVLPQLIEASTLKREVVEGVDVMVVRELTGDVYFGTPKGIDVIDGMLLSDWLDFLLILCVGSHPFIPARFLHSLPFQICRTTCRIQQHDLLGKRD